MKKRIIGLALLGIVLSGCGGSGGGFSPSGDKEGKLKPVEGQEGYYTHTKLSFVAEIMGSYKSNRPFQIDEDNENLWIWDDLYLYEKDYFQLIENDSPNIYYVVNDDDLEYVAIDTDEPYAVIREGKAGIYKIIFDTSTKIFDMEYKAEITTPVYEKMDGCDVYSLKSGFKQMVPNPNNKEELMIADFITQTGHSVSFYNHGRAHLSNYRVFLDKDVVGKYADAMEDGDKAIMFGIGGKYNIYVNPTTYAVRIELVDVDGADYTLKYINKVGEFIDVKDHKDDKSYIFTHQLSVEANDPLPIYSSTSYMMFDLEIAPNDYLTPLGYFKVAGTYTIEVNLKAFTLSLNLIEG